MQPSSQAQAQSDTQQQQQQQQARPYAHLTTRSFTSLIRNLDASSTASSSSSARKARRVADVDSPSSMSIAAFQALTGSKLAHLHRERRRSQKAQLNADASGTAQAQAGGPASTYTPFSQAHLMQRIKELTAAPTTTWTTHAAKQAAPLELALRGWSRSKEGKVQCVTCAAEWSGQETDDHKQWCPWRCRGCKIELFQVPVLTRHAALDLITAEAEKLARIQGIEKLQVQGLDDDTLASLSSALQPATLPSPAIALALLGWSLPSTSSSSSNNATALLSDTLISCNYCARRLGLWSFATESDEAESDTTLTPRRKLDVVTEHRTFCPLINAQVQAGTLPSTSASSTPPTSTSSDPAQQPLSGWQLRLRCALGRKAARPRSASEEGEEETPRLTKMRKSQVLADVRSMLAPSSSVKQARSA